MFVFEDIVSLDDKAIQLILRQVDTRELATALKGVRPEVKDKIGSNMSERAAQNLDEEIKMLGPVRTKTVEEAQGAIVRAIRRSRRAARSSSPAAAKSSSTDRDDCCHAPPRPPSGRARRHDRR